MPKRYGLVATSSRWSKQATPKSTPARATLPHNVRLGIQHSSFFGTAADVLIAELENATPQMVGEDLELFSFFQSGEDEPVMKLTKRPDLLISARFVHPSTILLSFEDGRSWPLDIELLGIPLKRVRWPTVEASQDGTTMTIQGAKGEGIPIDSSTLRYLVDRDYAEQVREKLKAIQFTREELKELAESLRPPDEFLEQSSEDLRSESWK